ncbi:MAG: sugar phosphate nucleotidyltransferase [Actinomycetota bacterium]
MDVVGIALVGGRGERARPITVKAPGYLRSKAAMSFCGKRLIQWLIESLRLQGIRQFFVIAHGKENRYQTKTLVGFGDSFGVNIRYSRVRFDAVNTGSADATLRMLDHWDIHAPALVFPTDSLYDFSLQEMFDQHQAREATVTVAAMTRGPTEVAGKYGVMLADPSSLVREFVEKPTLDKLRQHFPTPTEEDFHRLPLWTNAGMYLVDSLAVRKLGRDPEVDRMRQRRLDFGIDLLPWGVSHGMRVYAHPANRAGDLGSVVDYLDTMVSMLRGHFRSLTPLMGNPFDAGRNVWIHPETLRYHDETSGLTLEEKLEKGMVEIGPNVRLGKYVEVGPGSKLEDCNVDDGVDLGEGVEIRRSAIRDGVMVGAHSTITDSYLGSMVEVQSSRRHPTILGEHVGVGDEVVIQPGVRLKGRVSVYPRLKVPAAASVPPGAELRDAADVLRYL